jgi:hypothetical protein
MRNHVAGKQNAADDPQHAVADRLNRLAADRYDMGISKLVSRYDKCFSVESDCVEQLVNVCVLTCIFVFFPIFNAYFLIAKRSLLSDKLRTIQSFITVGARVSSYADATTNGTRKRLEMISLW